MADNCYYNEQNQSSDDEITTSSAESSDDDYIDVENGEMDKTWALNVQRKTGKKPGLRHKVSIPNVKFDKNKKRHHNASERMRREQLKACFAALKTAIHRPDSSNNEALKHVANAIDEATAKIQGCEERIKKLKSHITDLVEQDKSTEKEGQQLKEMKR